MEMESERRWEAVRRHHRRTLRPAVTSGGLLSSYGSSKQPRSSPGLSGRARNIRFSRPTATVSSSNRGSFEDEMGKWGDSSSFWACFEDGRRENEVSSSKWGVFEDEIGKNGKSSSKRGGFEDEMGVLGVVVLKSDRF